MADKKVLSNEDIDFLQRFIFETTRKRKGKRQPQPLEIVPSSESLMVMTPEEGIPALLEFVPGIAECEVYKRDIDNDTLIDANFTVLVYNITTCDIPGSTLIGVKKDRWGSWFVGTSVIVCETTTGTSTSTSTSTFFDEPGTSTSTSTALTTTTGTSSSVTSTGTSPGTGIIPGTGTTPGTGVVSPCTPIVINEQDTRCENGALNVYIRDVSLNIVSGCLSKTTGLWAFSHSAGSCTAGGGLVIINITEITNLTVYQYNTFYFNSYDFTLNINILGIWYSYCVCYTHTGTGTGTHAYHYWCMSAPEPGTAEPTDEYIMGCQFCSEGVLDHLYLEFISGCPEATVLQAMVYSSTGDLGAGWYTATEEIGGLLQFWFIPCEYDSGVDVLHLLQIVNDVTVSDNTITLVDCSIPFNTGEFGIITKGPCEVGVAIVSIYQEPPIIPVDDSTPTGKVCVHMSQAEVDGFVSFGWTLHGGPYSSPSECAANCNNNTTGTSSVNQEFYWCANEPGTGTGTYDLVTVSCSGIIKQYPRVIMLTIIDRFHSNAGGNYCPDVVEQSVLLFFDETNDWWISNECVTYSLTYGAGVCSSKFIVTACSLSGTMLFVLESESPFIAHRLSTDPLVLNPLITDSASITPCSGSVQCRMQADFWLTTPDNPPPF